MSTKKLYYLLISLSLIVIFLGCLSGPTKIPIITSLKAIFGIGSPLEYTIIWEIRLPRTLAAYLVGLSLGASGAALQGLLRNPLAEPGVLGVSACASLGATIVIYYGIAQSFTYSVPLAAVTGALIGTTLLAIIAEKANSVTALILIGVGISSLGGAGMALLTSIAPNPFYLSDMVTWMLGSVANTSSFDIALCAPFLCAGFLLLRTQIKGLSVLTLGEETAGTLGLNLSRNRMLVVLSAGILTGTAVSLAGVIGFVGIVAPHLIRPLVEHDPGKAIVPSALLAAIILVVADIAVRLFPTDAEIKLGVVAALIGAPIFIMIVYRRNNFYEQN